MRKALTFGLSVLLATQPYLAGAAASAAIGPGITAAVQRTLNDAGLASGSSSTLGNLLGQLVTTGIGAAAGGAGAATAASVDINNYLNHADSDRRDAAKAKLDACQTQPGSCSSDQIATLRQTVTELDTKDRNQQQAYVDCRASGYNGDGCGKVFLNAVTALSSYSGRGTADSNLEQIVAIMAPDGVDNLTPKQQADLTKTVRALANDPTGLTALPAQVAQLLEGDPLAAAQLVGILAKVPALKAAGNLGNAAIEGGAAGAGAGSTAVKALPDGYTADADGIVTGPGNAAGNVGKYSPVTGATDVAGKQNYTHYAVVNFKRVCSSFFLSCFHLLKS